MSHKNYYCFFFFSEKISRSTTLLLKYGCRLMIVKSKKFNIVVKTEQNLDKRRIAKNTLLLYARMFLMILIGLYTSRVILKALGISDYGVYNVVGGMVSMFAFLNSAMVAASQRFISYELGCGDKERLNLVFCTSINIHAIIAVVIFILAETIGLWFVNTQLVIDPDRMVAANWVYQFSVLTFMVTVVSVPYNSCIVAHEHMKAFAYYRHC